MNLSGWVSTAVLAALILVVGFAAVRFIVEFNRARRRVSELFDNRDLEGVREALDRLCSTRVPGAFLIFEDMRSKRFVQLRRQVGPAGATLTCNFPKAPWSHEYVDALQSGLAAKGIPYAEVPGGVDEPVTGFIEVDNLTVTEAVELVDFIFRQVFGCPTVSVRVWGHGVTAGTLSTPERLQGSGKQGSGKA